MNITEAIEKYKASTSASRRDNLAGKNILSAFKKDAPILSEMQSQELIKILKYSQDWDEKYFVAELLLYYDSFSIRFLYPLLTNAIGCDDPARNGTFLKAAERVFGNEMISEVLAEKFIEGSVMEKIKVSSLVYWIDKDDNYQMQKLEKVIAERAANTHNLVELYYYHRYLPDIVGLEREIPVTATELLTKIQGNQEYEELLYSHLGWKRPNQDSE